MGNKRCMSRTLHAPELDTPRINNDGEKLISLEVLRAIYNLQQRAKPLRISISLLFVFVFFSCFNFFLWCFSLILSISFLSSDGKFPVSYSIVRRATTNGSLRYTRCTAIMIESHFKCSSISVQNRKMMLNASR